VLEIIFTFIIKRLRLVENFENAIRTNDNGHVYSFFIYIVIVHLYFLLMYNSFIYYIIEN